MSPSTDTGATVPGPVLDAMREEKIARAALAAVKGEAVPIGDEVKQLIADAAVGRAIREAAAAAPTETPIHLCWFTPAGRTTGRWSGVGPLYAERANLADAARELLDAIEESDHGNEGGEER